MDEFLNWSTLATYSGATFATTLLTQLLKGIPFLEKLPTRVVSYVLAVLVLLAATAFTGGFSAESAVLALVNGAVVSLASNGTFDAVTTVRGTPQSKQ